MSSSSPEDLLKSLEISDPGERNRENHLWGDRLMINIGNVTAWLFPVLMIAIVTQVVIRKAGFNQAWLDDMQWWLYGFAMLVAFGYAITTDSHVRVDILHQSYSKAKKARIEIFALGWLLLPFLVIMTDIMLHYGYASWVSGEGSDSPNGLHRLYLLKMSMPVLFTAAGIAAWAALYRQVLVLAHPTLWRLILAALPAIWFITERLIHYAIWWYVRLTNPEINSRRINKEPLLDGTTTYALIVIMVVLVLALLLSTRSKSKD